MRLGVGLRKHTVIVALKQFKICLQEPNMLFYYLYCIIIAYTALIGYILDKIKPVWDKRD